MLSDAPLEVVVNAFLDFYETVRFSGLANDDESDGLLFEYLVLPRGNPRGALERFQFGITRQFAVPEGRDGIALSWLACHFNYKPLPGLRALGSQGKWCFSRSGLARFRSMVLSSEAFQAVQPLETLQREIWWERI